MSSDQGGVRAWAGVKQPKILFLGEAWGEQESHARKPFVGSAGKELFQCLGEAWPQVSPDLHAQICRQHPYDLLWVSSREQWFEEAGVAFTNVFNFQPPSNKLEHICTSKKEMKEQHGKDYADNYPLPPLKQGKYVPLDLARRELDRLAAEITEANPTLIVALGNTAIWALLRATNISSLRGYATMTHESWPQVKVLPTFHPANILYNWSQRPILLADLMKAQRESAFPEIRRPKRRVLIDPTIEEVETYCARLIAKAEFTHSTPSGRSTGRLEVSADTETAFGQITMISLAARIDEAITIPFADKTKAGRSYWPDALTELRAWRAVRRVIQCPFIRVVGQNFIYDMQYLAPCKIFPSCVPEDTMLLHHALYPEMMKGLGFLGSIYTDEASWKMLRQFKPDTEKRDE